MKMDRKVSAYALIYTLIITTIITLITSFILLQISNAKALELKREVKSKLIECEKNLIRLALSKHFDSSIENRNSYAIQFYDNIQSQIKTESWGVFKVFSFQNRSNIDSLYSHAFIGHKDYSFRNTALYLKDNNQPLNISGTSLIRGQAYLPKSGIKPAIVNSRSFVEDRMIYGEMEKSSSTLPKIQVQALEDLIDKIELGHFETTEIQESICRSFGENALHQHFGEKGFLDECFYKGKIILSASEEMRISKNAQLEDIIIIAPRIVIGYGSKLSAQLCATESIDISENVSLNYTSMLFLDKKGEDGKIRIGKNSKVEGLILAKQSDPKNRNALIILEKNSEVLGMVYSEGIIDIESNIMGTVISDNLQYSGNGSLYLSYLFNSTIDNNALPKYFVLAELFAKRSNKSIIKWLE